MSATERTFTFLGTGTSVGIPMIGCDCAVCRSSDPRNNRYRCSVLIGTPQGNILIDTTPEMRLQLLRAKVELVHAVLFTHYHADHALRPGRSAAGARSAGRPGAALLHERRGTQDTSVLQLCLSRRTWRPCPPATFPN